MDRISDKNHVWMPARKMKQMCSPSCSRKESNKTSQSFQTRVTLLCIESVIICRLHLIVKENPWSGNWLLSLRHCQVDTLKAMTKKSRVFSGSILKTVVSTVACLGIMGISALATAPIAEANQKNRQLRRENRQLRRVVRHDRRDWRRNRRNVYSNGRYSGYRPLRPAYAYGYGYRNGARYYRPSGFHVQVGF